MKEYKNILVVQTAFPGDIILTTPLFKGIKEIFEGSRLTVLTTPYGRDLLDGIREIDDIITYDKKGADRGWSGFTKVIREIRKGSFDLCISPHRSARTSFMLMMSGIPDRVGFEDASLSLLYNRRVKRDTEIHEVKRVLSLLGPFSPVDGWMDRYPYLEVSEGTREMVSRILEDEGIKGDRKIVCVAPGSVWETKRWTENGFSSLVDTLASAYGVQVVLVGAKSESGIGERVTALSKNRPVNLIGKTDLRLLVGIIDRSRMVIANDSAPGHIAAARKVPVVSIFGPTVPAFGYYPYGKEVEIVEKDLYCRPCHHHGPKVCPEGHFRCMRDIAVGDVMNAVQRLGVL